MLKYQENTKFNFIEYFQTKNSTAILNDIFNYLPQKRKYLIASVNIFLKKSLDLKKDDYFIQKDYQKIIKESEGKIPVLIENVCIYYKKSNCTIPFRKILLPQIMQYINYLYKTKQIKQITFYLTCKFYYSMLYTDILVEMIRKIKIKSTFAFVYKHKNNLFYNLIKDTLVYQNEIYKIIIKLDSKFFRRNYNIEDYFGIYDWSRVNCIELYQLSISNANILDYAEKLPTDNKIKKIIFTERATLFQMDIIIQLHKLFNKFGKNIEYLKFNGFQFQCSKIYQKFNELKYDNNHLGKLNKLKILKAKTCLNHIISIFKFCFLNLKKLTLDNIDINLASNISEITNIKSLEKLEISASVKSNKYVTNYLLNKIIENNNNLKKLKIGLPNNFMKNNEKKQNECNNIISFYSRSLKREIPKNESQNKDLIYENENPFEKLIKNISSLKHLNFCELDFLIDCDNINILNEHFKVGENLKHLKIIFLDKLSAEKIFSNNPFLNEINFERLIDESQLNIKKMSQSKNKDILLNQIKSFKLNLPKNKFEKIELKNIPMTDNILEILNYNKNNLKFISFEWCANASNKTDQEVFNILSEISENINRNN